MNWMIPILNNRDRTFKRIRLERDRHDLKWGPGSLVDGTHEKALAVAVEELGEVAREVLERKPGWQARLRTEIAQTAAFMAAWHELGDWTDRKKTR